MVDERAENLAKDVIRNELKAAEAMDELSESYSNEEINDAMESILGILIENVEDPSREATIYQLIFTVGQRIGSEAMARRGKELYEGFVEKHGE
jgi:hypothetical protein